VKIDIHSHGNKVSKENILIKVLPPTYDSKEAQQSFCYGIHPWDVDNVNMGNCLRKLKELSKNKFFFALGEIGLDKVRGPEIGVQTKVLQIQIEIAIQEDIRIIVFHCVKAYSELFDLLSKSKYTGAIILHDYNSTLQMAEQYLKHFNVYFSFGAKLANSSTKSAKSIQGITQNRIFLETDDQLELTIEDIYTKASLLLGVSPMALEKQIHKNYLFLLNSK
jgi:TatD DNase family protein